jgi:putative mRNA 3-end processing factor
LQLRLGNNNYQGVEWNETVIMNGAKISLYPAGHMIGSSQIRVEYNGEVWVVSGDYKTENDGISGEFELVPCNTFITESTFGLPIYRWKSQVEIFANIKDWIRNNQLNNKTSVLIAYSLGKAQRLLQVVNEVTENIFVHGSIWNTQETLRLAGWNLPQVKRILSDTQKALFNQAVVIAPPSADNSLWLKRFTPYSVGICSGWMQVRGNVRRSNVDAGFALSDHADWTGLLETVKGTGAEKVFVTHGFQSVFSRYLNEIGIPAGEVKTEFGEEENTEANIAIADEQIDEPAPPSGTITEQDNNV